MGSPGAAASRRPGPRVSAAGAAGYLRVTLMSYMKGRHGDGGARLDRPLGPAMARDGAALVDMNPL